MTSPRQRAAQKANLAKGQAILAQKRADGTLKPPSPNSGSVVATASRISGLVQTEPQKVILELFEVSARATTRLLRRWEKSGDEPSRNLIDATKECRQLAAEALEVYKATAGDAAAEQFFATMDARLERIAGVLEEHSRGFEPVAS